MKDTPANHVASSRISISTTTQNRTTLLEEEIKIKPKNGKITRIQINNQSLMLNWTSQSKPIQAKPRSEKIKVAVSSIEILSKSSTISRIYGTEREIGENEECVCEWVWRWSKRVIRRKWNRIYRDSYEIMMTRYSIWVRREEEPPAVPPSQQLVLLGSQLGSLGRGRKNG